MLASPSLPCCPAAHRPLPSVLWPQQKPPNQTLNLALCPLCLHSRQRSSRPVLSQSLSDLPVWHPPSSLPLTALPGSASGPQPLPLASVPACIQLLAIPVPHTHFACTLLLLPCAALPRPRGGLPSLRGHRPTCVELSSRLQWNCS